MVRVLALLAAFAVCAAPALAQADSERSALPRPNGEFVCDFAGVISATDRSILEDDARGLAAGTGVRVLCVTLPDVSKWSGGRYTELEPLAKELFQQWGVGRKPQDDGVLIVLLVGAPRLVIHMGDGCSADLRAARLKICSDAPAYLREGSFGRVLLLALAGVSRVVHGLVESADGRWVTAPPATAVPGERTLSKREARIQERVERWGTAALGVFLFAVLAGSGLRPPRVASSVAGLATKRW